MIVDASVAVKWLIREEGDERARALLDRIDLMAPSLIHVEVANVIWRKRRRGELDDRRDLLALPASLASLVQGVDEVALLPRALELAFMLDHAIYDCVYLALAEASGDVFVTADDAFRRKVERTPLAPLVVAL